MSSLWSSTAFGRWRSVGGGRLGSASISPVRSSSPTAVGFGRRAFPEREALSFSRSSRRSHNRRIFLPGTHPVENRDELLEVQRFRKEPLDAGKVVRQTFPSGCEDNNRNPRKTCVRELIDAELASVHHGHFEIEQDETGSL